MSFGERKNRNLCFVLLPFHSSTTIFGYFTCNARTLHLGRSVFSLFFILNAIVAKNILSTNTMVFQGNTRVLNLNSQKQNKEMKDK